MKNESETPELLAELTESMAQADLLTMQERSLIDALIPEDVKASIADVKVEFSDRRAAIAAQIEALKARITQQILAEGESASGGSIQAIYQKGRTSWDTKTLVSIHALRGECDEHVLSVL